MVHVSLRCFPVQKPNAEFWVKNVHLKRRQENFTKDRNSFLGSRLE